MAIPVVYTVLVFSVLVSAQFELVKRAYPSLPGPQAIMTNPYFMILSVAIWVICPVAYLIVRSLPPPKNRFVVAVAKFRPYSNDDEAEALRVRGRLRREIETRMKRWRIPGETIEPQEPSGEFIDPERPKGRERARLLGEHARAHIVICGTVSAHGDYEHGDYYLHPYIENLVAHPYRYSPSSDNESVPVPGIQRHSYMTQKVDEITDLATFICAMMKINQFEYEDADMILSTIHQRSAEAYFYHGLALLELGEQQLLKTVMEPHDNIDDDEQARSYFRRALLCFRKAGREKRNFVHAWMYAGIVSSKLGRLELAKECLNRARTEAEKASPEGASEDVYLTPRANLAAIITVLMYVEANLRDLDTAFNAVRDYVTRTDEELRSLLELSRRLKESRAQNDEGRECLEAGDYTKAIEAFHRAAELDPWNDMQALFHYNLARAYAPLGDMTNALAHLSIAAEQDAEMVRVLAPYQTEFQRLHTDEEFMELLKNL